MPIGVPIATATKVITRLPAIGLSRPPEPPGGGVISVKTARLRPLKPFHSKLAQNEHQPRQAEHRRADRQPDRDDVAAAARGVDARPAEAP